MDPEKPSTHSEPLFDDYEITSHILGTENGKFGTTSIGKKATTIIAIKELNYAQKSSTENFIKTKCHELLQLQSKLNLEHLIRYIDYRFENEIGKHYLMLEFCAQRDLGRYVEKQEVTLEKKLTLMVQCGKGLAALHSCCPQILHRYIKPENILIKTENGQDIVKITDYYMAAIHASGSTESAMSESRRLSGTEILPHEFYKPPEHFCSYEDTIDVIATTEGYDVFSLGVVYFALLNCHKDGLCPHVAESSDAIGHLMHLTKGPVNLFGENADASEKLLQIQKVLTEMLIFSEPSRPKAIDVVDSLERIAEEKSDGCNSEETKQEDLAISIFRKFSNLVATNGSLSPKSEKVVDFFLHDLYPEEQRTILKYGSISDYLIHWKDSISDQEASKLQLVIQENGQIIRLGTQSECLDDLQENNLSETESNNSSGSMQYESDEEYKAFTHQFNSDETLSQLVQYTYKNYHVDNKIYMIVNENIKDVRDHVQKHYDNHENITILSAVEEEDVWLMETVPNKKDQSSTQETENGQEVGNKSSVTTDICNKIRISELIGPGNFIMKDEKFNFLQTYLKNKQIYNFEEDLSMFGNIKGWCTLGCVVENKHDNKLYILSVKHLMNKNIDFEVDKEACIVSGFKHPYEILPGSSKRSYRNSITANDLVRTAKGYAGVYGVIEVQNQPQWVDVAVYEITDTLRSLHKEFKQNKDSKLKVVTTNDKTLKGRKVWKYGAKTGETHGKIIATGLNDRERVSDSKDIRGGGTFIVATVNDSGVPDEVCTFAEVGDSGSLVILDDKSNLLNAVGIIYKIKKKFPYFVNRNLYNIKNVTRCVRLNTCMEALQRYMGVNWCPELYYYYFVPQCLFTHSKPEDSHREEHKEKLEYFDFYS